MSFDKSCGFATVEEGMSQSLSIRAMSFDEEGIDAYNALIGLNPFRSGQCLSTNSTESAVKGIVCLNPFRSGQCLST